MPVLALEKLYLYNESSEVFFKTRPPPASLPFKGQATEQTTAKWSICSRLSERNSNLIEKSISMMYF